MRLVAFVETKRGLRADEEPYSCMVTIPDDDIAPVSAKDGSHLGEGFVDQHLLLELVARLAPRRGARALGPRDDPEGEALVEVVAEARLEEVPGSHVVRLLLHPHEVGARRVCVEDLAESGAERVVLLEPDDGDVGALLLLARLVRS
jgi:hypothetical protein